MKRANRARVSGAHKMAFGYYKAAISLLSPGCWEGNDYSSTHFLYTNAVSLAWVVGENELTEEYLEAIFKHATNPMDRVIAYRTQHRYCFSRQLHDQGAAALKKCIEELGDGLFLWGLLAKKKWMLNTVKPVI